VGAAPAGSTASAGSATSPQVNASAHGKTLHLDFDEDDDSCVKEITVKFTFSTTENITALTFVHSKGKEELDELLNIRFKQDPNVRAHFFRLEVIFIRTGHIFLTEFALSACFAYFRFITWIMSNSWVITSARTSRTSGSGRRRSWT
jgi:hypothetical protein